MVQHVPCHSSFMIAMRVSCFYVIPKQNFCFRSGECHGLAIWVDYFGSDVVLSGAGPKEYIVPGKTVRQFILLFPYLFVIFLLNYKYLNVHVYMLMSASITDGTELLGKEFIYLEHLQMQKKVKLWSFHLSQHHPRAILNLDFNPSRILDNCPFLKLNMTD